MTANDFCDLVKMISYKPGWRLMATLDENFLRGTVLFHLQHDAIDSADRKSKTQVMLSEYVGPEMLEAWTRPRAIDWIGAQIKRAEIHELEEFFRVNGTHVNDPHPEITELEKQGRHVRRAAEGLR